MLTRADRHNALDVAMRDQLHAALVEAGRGDGPILVRGDGPSFCSGGDLDEFGTFPDPVIAHVIRLQRSLASVFDVLAGRLVVAVHGACLGAGIELPAFVRHVIAAEDASIGLPEQGIGLVPGAGGTVSVTRRVGALARPLGCSWATEPSPPRKHAPGVSSTRSYPQTICAPTRSRSPSRSR